MDREKDDFSDEEAYECDHCREPWNCMDGLNSCDKIMQGRDKHV
ncbi:MAG: hypothetical protein ACMUJM_14930 [bacterium]